MHLIIYQTLCFDWFYQSIFKLNLNLKRIVFNIYILILKKAYLLFFNIYHDRILL